jgi:hypothetical protein
VLQILHRRTLSSIRSQQPGSLPDYQVDPYRLLEDDLKEVYDDIREVSLQSELENGTVVINILSALEVLLVKQAADTIDEKEIQNCRTLLSYS